MEGSRTEVRKLKRELDSLLYVLADLVQVKTETDPWSPVWPGIQYLHVRFYDRYARCYQRYTELTQPALPVAVPATEPLASPVMAAIPTLATAVDDTAPEPAPAPAPAPTPPLPPALPSQVQPPAPLVPRPSLRELGRRFVTEHGILLMSYAGAFLLIVATLLFELYGPADMPGGLRLTAIAGLNVFFAAASVFCWRRAALRLVAASYTAIAALMWPLTLIAAYQYLLRDAAQLTATTGVALAAAACAVVYGFVARALGSRAYASLAISGLAVAGVSSCVSLGTGPAALPAAAAFTCISWLLARTPRSPFALPSYIAGHIGSATAVGTAITWAAVDGFAGGVPYFLYLPLTTLTVSAAYWVRYRLAGDDDALVLAGTLLTAVPVAATQSFGLGLEGTAASLVGVGLVTAAISRLPLRGLRLAGENITAADVVTAVAWIGAGEVVSACLVRMSNLAVQDAVLVAAVLAGLVLASRARSEWWLATGLAALCCQLLVHRRPDTTPAYVPVALVTELAAVTLLGVLRRNRWFAIPMTLLLAAATLTAGSVLGWTVDGQAMALVGVATATTLGAVVLPVRVTLPPDTPDALRGLDNVLAWLAALEAITAGFIPVSNPSLQFVLLGIATACGLALTLSAGSRWYLSVGLATLFAQLIAHSGDLATADYVPAYVPAALGAVLLTLVVTAMLQRNRWLIVPANIVLIAATLTAGGTLSWSIDGDAMALIGIASATTLAALCLPVRFNLPQGTGNAWRGLDNVLVWLAALEAVAAGAIPVSNASLQFVLLGMATAIGLALTLSLTEPWYLAVGVATLVVQVLAHSSDLANAAYVPAYIPAALGAVLVALVITAVLQRNRWLNIPVNIALIAGTLTAGGTLGWSLEGRSLATVGVAFSAAVACRLIPLRQLVTADWGRYGLANPMAWMCGLEAIGAGAFPVSDPYAQFALFGVAVLCGLVCVLITTSPWWLLIGVGTLVAHLSAHAGDLTSAAHAPAYVPATLGASIIALGVVAFRQRNRWLSVPAFIALIPAVSTTSSTLGWSVEATSLATVGVALAAAVASRVLPAQPWSMNDIRIGRGGLVNPLAWIAGLEALGASGISVSDTRVQLTVLGLGVVCGMVCVLVTTSPWWLLIGVACLATQSATDSAAIGAAGHLPAYVPITLAVVLVSIVVTALIHRDWRLVIPANLCVTAMVITANSAATGGVRGYAIEFVVLGWTAAVSSPLIKSVGARAFVRLDAGVRFAIAAFIIVSPAWTEAALLAAAAAGVLYLAFATRRSDWLFLAGAVFLWSWYWASTAIAGSITDPQRLATAYGAVPLVIVTGLGAMCALAPSARSRTWAEPFLGFAGITALLVEVVAIGTGAWTLLSWSLLVNAALIYAAARMFRFDQLVYIAVAGMLGSVLALLAAVAADIVLYPLCLGTLAWTARYAWRVRSVSTDSPAWHDAHKRSSLIVATLAALTPTVAPALVSGHADGPLAELAASLSLAAIVWTGVSQSGWVRDRYAALLIAGLAVDWLPVFAGTREPQAYVLVPAIALITCGVLVRQSSRAGSAHAISLAFIAVGAGSGLITTLAEVSAAGDTSGYTAWLLLEGIAMIGGGIVSRQRVLGVLGSAAIVIAAIRALVTAVQVVPLYAVFGTAALLLLGIAAMLAAARSHITEARHVLREAWSTWD